MTAPSVSVVIPTKNRLENLQRTLGALARQTHDAALFEVLVGDDGSSDGTAAFLAAPPPYPFSLRSVRLPGSGPAAAGRAARRAAAQRFSRGCSPPLPFDTIPQMGPVWRLIKSGTAACDRCGREIADYPAVGRVVDFQFLPEQRYCWDCYRYISPFVDEVSPESATPFQPVTKPAIP